MRVAVFVSGSGTNLQALLDACGKESPARVVLVAANKKDAKGLERARNAGVDTHFIEDPTDGAAIVTTLSDYRIDLVVLAGYLKLVPEDVVKAFENRMLNIHPALLPSFGGPGMYGKRVHQAVLDSGATLSGVTVHIVTAEYDRGPIVAQWPVPVRPNDSVESLQQRVLAVEHALLPAIVLAAAEAQRVSQVFPNGGMFRVLPDETPAVDVLGPHT
jgi:formyltetrahydrofolate-dependent phosphoribosylglycinamide formyltransferase